MHNAQRVVQLEEQLEHVKELESMLAGEREQVDRLKKELAEARSATARVDERDSLRKQVTTRVRTLDRAFATEREQCRSLGLSPPDAGRASQRARAFESLLRIGRELKTFWQD